MNDNIHEHRRLHPPLRKKKASDKEAEEIVDDEDKVKEKVGKARKSLKILGHFGPILMDIEVGRHISENAYQPFFPNLAS